MITLSDHLIESLRAHGVTTHHGAGAMVAPDCFFEPPCSIKWMQLHHSLHLGAFSYAVSGFYFACRIGRYVSIGEDVQIGRHAHPTSWSSTSPVFYQPYQAALNLELPIVVEPDAFLLGQPGQQVQTTTIGNDVWIGHGAFIVPGVTIGDGAVVGARSVVTRDVPPYSIVAGAPAIVRKMRFGDDIIARMQRLQWWRYAFWDLKGASITNPPGFLDAVEAKICEGLKEYQAEVVSLKNLTTTSPS